MVELALVLPFFFLLVFGVLELSLMTYGISGSRFAAGEAARVVSQVGRDDGFPCNVKCADLALPARGGGICNADCEALVAVVCGPAMNAPEATTSSCTSRSAVGGSTMIQINEVDIYQLTQAGNGALTPPCQLYTGQPSPPACSTTTARVNRYKTDGSKAPKVGDASYDPDPAGSLPGCGPTISGGGWAGRNDCFGQTDFIGVTINYQYNWKTGIFASVPVPKLVATFYVRMEPRRFLNPSS
jgi:Flp pilus assembly protein TadG